jgi:hypothetical protein
MQDAEDAIREYDGRDFLGERYIILSIACKTRTDSIGSSSSHPERTDDQGRITSMSLCTCIELTSSRPPRDGRGPGGPPRRGVRLHVVGIPDRTSWQVGFFPTLLFLVLAIGSSFHFLYGRVILLLLCVVVQWRFRFTLGCPGWSSALGLQDWRLLVESGWHRMDRRAPGESPPGWNDVSLLCASLGWSTSSLSIIFSLNIPYAPSLLWSYVVSVQS